MRFDLQKKCCVFEEYGKRFNHRVRKNKAIEEIKSKMYLPYFELDPDKIPKEFCHLTVKGGSTKAGYTLDNMTHLLEQHN